MSTKKNRGSIYIDTRFKESESVCDNARVRFILPSRRTISVFLQDGALIISGDDAITVNPKASNRIEIL